MKIKYNYNSTPVAIYCSFDPAIDQEKSDIESYMKTRDDSFLKFKPGSTPTKFFVRNIPMTTFSGIDQRQSAALLAAFYFSWGVSHIENLNEVFLNSDAEIENDGLSIIEPTDFVTMESGKQIKYWNPQEIINCFNGPVIHDIGHVVLKKTQLAKKKKLDCLVLASSIDAIAKMNS